MTEPGVIVPPAGVLSRPTPSPPPRCPVLIGNWVSRHPLRRALRSSALRRHRFGEDMCTEDPSKLGAAGSTENAIALLVTPPQPDHGAIAPAALR